MTFVAAQSGMDRPEHAPLAPAPPRAREPATCGGAQVLDLALCLILAVTVVGLLVLAL